MVVETPVSSAEAFSATRQGHGPAQRPPASFLDRALVLGPEDARSGWRSERHLVRMATQLPSATPSCHLQPETGDRLGGRFLPLPPRPQWRDPACGQEFPTC